MPSVDAASENTQNLLSSGLQSTTHKQVDTAAVVAIESHSLLYVITHQIKGTHHLLNNAFVTSDGIIMKVLC